MRFRSSGLGNTELYAKVVDLEIKEDLLIMHFNTYKPVEWHLKAAMQAQDRLDLVKALLRLNVKLLPYLFKWRSKNPPREPEAI